jgi:hypothetical protein
MWKYSGKVIRVGRSWTDNDGITHPAQWARWSAEDKAAKGLVWEDDPAPFDSRFYWSADVPKNIDDVNEVWGEDEVGMPEGTSAGDPKLDSDGEQIITRGLKYNAIQTVKTQAGGLLAPTDWMVIKATEVADYTVPADVLTYRAAVRTASNTIEAAITACADLDAFMALYDTPMDDQDPPQPTGNAPINDWPEAI